MGGGGEFGFEGWGGWGFWGLGVRGLGFRVGPKLYAGRCIRAAQGFGRVVWGSFGQGGF